MNRRTSLLDQDALLVVRVIKPTGDGAGVGACGGMYGDGTGTQYGVITWPYNMSGKPRRSRPYQYANKSVDDWLVVALRLQGWSP